MTVPSLDVWFIIFDYISDHNTLWSILRNISRHTRICVDEYFRHAVLRHVVIDLVYSTIHSQPGPYYNYIHVPLRFDRLSDDSTRAVFRQVAFKERDSNDVDGSIHGWVPFIEQYCNETRQPTPIVTKKSASTKDKPMWEHEDKRWRREYHYQPRLRDHLSIGRDDRPPYFIKLPSYTQDTELVDLAIDCSAREISFDWRRTLSAFFLEQNFGVLADRGTEQKRIHDPALDAAVPNVILITRMEPSFDNRHLDNYRRARRKRLQPWLLRTNTACPVSIVCSPRTRSNT
ncbi:hypothetical protein EK21DRAFT_86093 [Setomelanomma holmii]|uniref:Uncharacterized protein n=1 Tax=Setomelanomma holmii TaxID=210430 RepID=A0A9P4LPY1_9PLEO|nr:hypothetical protein EK21DRAFT_86093 [Setomelanomma holmii]